MAGDTLRFSVDGNLVYPPFETAVGPITFSVTNYGTDTLTGLGFYIRPATTQGSVDLLATNSPETDFQDLLTWGTRTDLGIVANGGMIVVLPQTAGPDITEYVTRTQGSSAANKLPFKDLDPGETAEFTVELELPPSYSTRRIYVDIGIE